MTDDDIEQRARQVGLTLNRRAVIKGALGAGGAIVAGAALDGETEAARRGYSGPAAPPSNDDSGWLLELGYGAVLVNSRNSVVAPLHLQVSQRPTVPALYVDIQEVNGSYHDQLFVNYVVTTALPNHGAYALHLHWSVGAWKPIDLTIEV